MPKIRRDHHGLCVSASGRLYRPVHSRETKALFPDQRQGSDLYENDGVRVIPVPGAPLCKITDHHRTEMWFDHGAHDVTIPSHKVWRPWFLKEKQPPKPPKPKYFKVQKAAAPAPAPVTVNGVVPPPARIRKRA